MDNNLKKALEEAKDSIDKEPNGRLLLSYRRKIWAALGPCTMDGEKAKITVQLIRRVKLAILCAQRVLPIWEEVYSDEYNAKRILELTEDYLEGMNTWKRCYDKFNEFSSLLTNLESGHIMPFAAGTSISLTLSTALYDELFDDEEMEPDFEEDREVDMWDASFAASVAESGLYWYGEENNIEKRKAFWSWYLNDAVPSV